jgi:hypothetical protein
MKSIRRAVGRVGWLFALGLAAGCGMAPKAEAPSSGGQAAPAEAAPTSTQAATEEREPATLADAEARLESARADLDRLALNQPEALQSEAAGAAAPPPAAAPSPAPSRDEARRADKSAADDAEKPQAKEVSACETACKAFSSLTRASDAVCRLDTEGGRRCERAQQIRQDASRRVASCGCAK